MNETGSQDEGSREAQQQRKRGSLLLLTNWIRVIIGIALVAEGGVLYASARVSDGGPSWLFGAVAIVVGAVLALPGVAALYARGRTPELIIAEPIPGAREDSIPMLGALLVYRYKLITEEQLQKALEVQRKDGPNRRLLGGILLDMGLISSTELQTALEHQRSLTGKQPEADDPATKDDTEALAAAGKAH